MAMARSGTDPTNATEVERFVEAYSQFYAQRQGRAAPEPPDEPAVGPDDPCPCGSGKKYKKCCGR
jgi:uncharacterized protein YecA (UPF0149 family)